MTIRRICRGAAHVAADFLAAVKSLCWRPSVGGTDCGYLGNQVTCDTGEWYSLDAESAAWLPISNVLSAKIPRPRRQVRVVIHRSHHRWAYPQMPRGVCGPGGDATGSRPRWKPPRPPTQTYINQNVAETPRTRRFPLKPPVEYIQSPVSK